MNYNFLRRIGVIILLTIAGIIIQGSLLHYVAPGMLVPNFLMIMVVFIGFYDASSGGSFQAFLIGMISDLCSGVLVGPSAGSFVLVYGVLALLASRIFVESAVATMVIVFVATIASSLLNLVMVYQFSPSVGHGFAAMAGEGLVTGLLAPFVFKLLKRVLVVKERMAQRSIGRSRARLVTP